MARRGRPRRAAPQAAASAWPKRGYQPSSTNGPRFRNIESSYGETFNTYRDKDADSDNEIGEGKNEKRLGIPEEWYPEKGVIVFSGRLAQAQGGPKRQ
jgi:hypothetical protein